MYKVHNFFTHARTTTLSPRTRVTSKIETYDLFAGIPPEARAVAFSRAHSHTHIRTGRYRCTWLVYNVVTKVTPARGSFSVPRRTRTHIWCTAHTSSPRHDVWHPAFFSSPPSLLPPCPFLRIFSKMSPASYVRYRRNITYRGEKKSRVTANPLPGTHARRARLLSKCFHKVIACTAFIGVRKSFRSSPYPSRFPAVRDAQ